jgi:phage baseplate assembly protein V
VQHSSKKEAGFLMEFRFIRTGKVSSINYKECSARVEFDDAPGIISKELKVLLEHSNKEKDYSMPSIGEDVVCIFLPHAPSVGFIVGSYYSGINLPGETGKIKYIIFPDGTKVKYDLESKILEVSCIGDINITAANGIKIKAVSLEVDAETTFKQKVTGVDIYSPVIKTDKGDIDDHLHKDSLNKNTTPPLG